MARKSSQTKDDQIISVTQETYDEMVRELEERKNVKRPEIAQKIDTARNLGDLTENFDYGDAMDEKDLNETRISELEERLKRVKILKSNSRDDVVQIGERIEVENLDTKEKKIVVLVGSEETQAANPLEGKLSIDSPIGSALYNAKIGETVEVKLPSKVLRYMILREIK